MQVASGDPHAAAKRQVLRSCGLKAEEVFPMRWDGWPAALLPYAAFVACRYAAIPLPTLCGSTRCCHRAAST